MPRGEWIALAIIVVAVVVRGWPRRRADRWRVRFEIDRDRSDSDDPGRDKAPAPSPEDDETGAS